ncbi:MAG: hypothetical protein KGI19_08820 [Thaumarchaeota archaeon]|nr:hypothetical protein [Nitrososphaerota archaeon]
MTAREPEFYNLFCTFMNIVLTHLQQRDDQKELVNQKNLRFYKTWRILLNEENSFTELKEFEEIKKWIEIRPEIAKQLGSHIGNGYVEAILSLDTVLIRMVYSHIQQSGLEPNEFLISGLYEELENFLFNKQLHVKLTTPLKGTNIEGHVKIETGLEIHDLNLDNELWEEIHMTYPNNGSIRNVIIHKFELSKIIENDDNSFYDLRDENYDKYFTKTRKLIEALRIFKSGNFGALETIEYSPLIHYDIRQLDGCAYLEDKFSYKKNDYSLSGGDVDKFQIFWHEYNKIGDDERFHRLKWAIDEFMDSYEDKFEYRFVQFIKLIETLFRLDKKETRHKFVLRITNFLDDTGVEKKQVRDFMNTAYEIRNDIIHGGNRDDFKVGVQPVSSYTEFTKDLENYVRMCITKFIHLMNDGKTRNDILAQLDIS